jgi:hypothetical protein
VEFGLDLFAALFGGTKGWRAAVGHSWLVLVDFGTGIG